MSDENSRTAKATATRQRKRNEARDVLFTTVSTARVAKTDWQLAYDGDYPLAFVRLALLEDARFLDLMRAGKIAVPARTLKLPKWAQLLTKDEQEQLPVVDSEKRLPLDLLPVAQTGDSGLDTDIAYLEEESIESARRLAPRRAKRKIIEDAIVFGRMIDQTAKTFEENAKLVSDNGTFRNLLQQRDGELARVKRALTNAEAKVARLEAEVPIPLMSGEEMEGDRAH